MKGNFLKEFFENSKVVIEVNHHKKYLLYKETKKCSTGPTHSYIQHIIISSKSPNTFTFKNWV
jgi:hypothetical protein